MCSATTAGLREQHSFQFKNTTAGAVFKLDIWWDGYSAI